MFWKKKTEKFELFKDFISNSSYGFKCFLHSDWLLLYLSTCLWYSPFTLETGIQYQCIKTSESRKATVVVIIGIEQHNNICSNTLFSMMLMWWILVTQNWLTWHYCELWVTIPLTWKSDIRGVSDDARGVSDAVTTWTFCNLVGNDNECWEKSSPIGVSDLQSNTNLRVSVARSIMVTI